MSDEKTKPPTPKKLADAHKDGESAKSPDVTAAVVLISITLALWLGAEFFAERLRRLFLVVWHFVPLHESELSLPISAMGTELLLLTVPLAFAGMLGAVIGLVGQGAMTMSAKPVMLKFNKVNPVEGMKRLFGMRAAIDAATILAKACVFGVLLWQTVRSMLPLLVGATARSPELLSAVLWQALMRMLFISIGAFIVFGLLDYGIQRFLFIRDHRMSEDEIKREYKEQNGNPEIKGKRKELAQELLFGDPRSAVASASMVVANPTHYAVALSCVRGEVPVVVAKGRDEVALMLRGHAEAMGVPVVVNPPLARTLHRVPVGAGIPRECFQIVALMLHTIEGMRSLHRRDGQGDAEAAT